MKQKESINRHWMFENWWRKATSSLYVWRATSKRLLRMQISSSFAYEETSVKREGGGGADIPWNAVNIWLPSSIDSSLGSIWWPFGLIGSTMIVTWLIPCQLVRLTDAVSCWLGCVLDAALSDFILWSGLAHFRTFTVICWLVLSLENE